MIPNLLMLSLHPFRLPRKSCSTYRHFRRTRVMTHPLFPEIRRIPRSPRSRLRAEANRNRLRVQMNHLRDLSINSLRVVWHLMTATSRYALVSRLENASSRDLQGSVVLEAITSATKRAAIDCVHTCIAITQTDSHSSQFHRGCNNHCS